MEVGQAINDFWTQWGAMIISILSSGAFGTIVVGIVRVIVGRFGRKVEGNAKTAQLTESQIGEIAAKVAALLSGAVLDIDLSKVVSDVTRQELGDMVKIITELKTQVTTANATIALMSNAISRSKLLTDQEQKELVATAAKLDTTEKAKISVKVEAKESSREGTLQEASIVNFGG